MTQWQGEGRRKSSGGIRTSVRRRGKLLSAKGGHFTEPKMGAEDKRSSKRARGHVVKVKQRSAKFAAVTVPASKKTLKAEILTVKENKANRLYTRRNIITKGCTIKVKLDGKEQLARVTSRPGQSGTVQAVLLEAQ
ncbi:MAG: 30S ribosomal protein S8e [Candidatus Diapherotrites archaeon]|nr:30S ribosomal protein S8e [Candidatus Diapherotrites archaeon]